MFCKFFLFLWQQPIWHQIGTHIGTAPGSSTPVNIADGFYYIPFLSSLEMLLNNENVLNQVNSVVCYVVLLAQYVMRKSFNPSVISGPHQSSGNLLVDMYVMVSCLSPVCCFRNLKRLYKLLVTMMNLQ